MTSTTPTTTAATTGNRHEATCTCNADACRRRRRKRYQLARARGERRLVDASPARRHLAELRLAGVGRTTVATALGCAELTLWRISTGQSKHVLRETEQKILGFQVTHAALVPNSRIVDATATRLRYQALIALGYTQEWITKSTGRSHVQFGLGERISRRRALAVLELCKQVGDTPGPSRKAATQARNKGWRLPATFDEELFYAPTWDGSEETTLEICAAFEYVAEYDWLAEAGNTVEHVAMRLGITVGYLQMLLTHRERSIGVFAPAAPAAPDVPQSEPEIAVDEPQPVTLAMSA